jgi:hypothetical protein
LEHYQRALELPLLEYGDLILRRRSDR